MSQHTQGPIGTAIYGINEAIGGIDSWLLVVNGPEYASVRQDMRHARENLARTVIGMTQHPYARLIAKAPEMYALLQAFVDMYPPDNHFSGTFDKARALLREIEGDKVAKQDTTWAAG